MLKLVLIFLLLASTAQAQANYSYNSSCGNGLCGLDETHYSCPVDCPSGSADRYCDAVNDRRCDPDCKRNQDPDCPKVAIPSSANESNLVFRIFIYGLAFGFLAVISLILYRQVAKEKVPHNAPPPKYYNYNYYDQYRRNLR